MPEREVSFTALQGLYFEDGMSWHLAFLSWKVSPWSPMGKKGWEKSYHHKAQNIVMGECNLKKQLTRRAGLCIITSRFYSDYQWVPRQYPSYLSTTLHSTPFTFPAQTRTITANQATTSVIRGFAFPSRSTPRRTMCFSSNTNQPQSCLYLAMVDSPTWCGEVELPRRHMWVKGGMDKTSCKSSSSGPITS